MIEFFVAKNCLKGHHKCKDLFPYQNPPFTGFFTPFLTQFSGGQKAFYFVCCLFRRQEKCAKKGSEKGGVLWQANWQPLKRVQNTAHTHTHGKQQQKKCSSRKKILRDTHSEKCIYVGRQCSPQRGGAGNNKSEKGGRQAELGEIRYEIAVLCVCGVCGLLQKTTHFASRESEHHRMFGRHFEVASFWPT